jgi:hypothetical protein
MMVKVAPGRAVRDPTTKMLMKEGDTRDVPENMFWRRRLRDGDVVTTDPPKSAPAPHRAAAHHAPAKE